MADLSALALNAIDTLSVPEIHGVVCGLAVWQADQFPLQELVDLVGVDALTDEYSVQAFVSAAVEALLADDMSFAPLLPEDGVELSLRVAAIAEWCAGFLAGFGAAGSARGMDSLDGLPDDAQEILADLSAITGIDIDSFADPEQLPGDAADSGYGGNEAEADLNQIQEFVKVGVLLMLHLITESPDEPLQ